MTTNVPISGLPSFVGPATGNEAIPIVSLGVTYQAALSQLLQAVPSGYVPTSREVIAGTGLTGGGPLSADVTLSLADTAVSASSYGSSTQVASFTVDAQGRLTLASNVAIDVAAAGGVPNTRQVIAGTGMSGGGALSSDVTLNLANTAVTPGVYGDATTIPQITVDAQGRITLAAGVASAPSGYVPTTRQVIAGTGMSGGGALSSDVTLNLANTAVTPAAYGAADTVATFTVDAQGRLTLAAGVAIAIANTAVSGLGTASTQNTGTSGATLPFLNGSNTWSGTQAFTATSSGGAPISLTLANDDAVGGTTNLFKSTNSPAAADVIWNLNGVSQDSGAGVTIYNSVQFGITDPTDTSEDGYIRFSTIVGGSFATRFTVGAGVYASGLTDEGAGTVNGTAFYRNDVITGWVQVGTITTTSGATQSITGLPVSDAFMLVWSGVSHNSGTTQSFSIAVSDDNGSTYGSAVQVTNAVGSSNSIYGRAFVLGCSVNAQSKIITPSLGGIGAVVCYNTIGVESTKTGVTSALQVAVSGDAFDAGTIYVYALI